SDQGIAAFRQWPAKARAKGEYRHQQGDKQGNWRGANKLERRDKNPIRWIRHEDSLGTGDEHNREHGDGERQCARWKEFVGNGLFIDQPFGDLWIEPAYER